MSYLATMTLVSALAVAHMENSSTINRLTTDLVVMNIANGAPVTDEMFGGLKGAEGKVLKNGVVRLKYDTGRQSYSACCGDDAIAKIKEVVNPDTILTEDIGGRRIYHAAYQPWWLVLRQISGGSDVPINGSDTTYSPPIEALEHEKAVRMEAAIAKLVEMKKFSKFITRDSVIKMLSEIAASLKKEPILNLPEHAWELLKKAAENTGEQGFDVQTSNYLTVLEGILRNHLSSLPSKYLMLFQRFKTIVKSGDARTLLKEIENSCNFYGRTTIIHLVKESLRTGNESDYLNAVVVMLEEAKDQILGIKKLNPHHSLGFGDWKNAKTRKEFKAWLDRLIDSGQYDRMYHAIHNKQGFSERMRFFKVYLPVPRTKAVHFHPYNPTMFWLFDFEAPVSKEEELTIYRSGLLTKQYRALMRQYHPDVTKVESNIQKFWLTAVQETYEVLKGRADKYSREVLLVTGDPLLLTRKAQDMVIYEPGEIKGELDR